MTYTITVRTGKQWREWMPGRKLCQSDALTVVGFVNKHKALLRVDEVSFHYAGVKAKAAAA